MLFPTFLLQLGQSEDHVDGGSFSTKSTLRLRIYLVCQNLKSLKNHPREDLPYDTQQGDSSVAVTHRAITFVLVLSHNFRVFKVLWKLTRLPTPHKKIVQRFKQYSTALLHNLYGYTIQSWRLSRRNLTYSTF